jgi:signal transduction histidine kinase
MHQSNRPPVHQARSHGVSVERLKEYGTLPLIECYAGQLNQVFVNILVNAIDAIEENSTKRTELTLRNYSGRITVRTSVIDAAG